MRRAVVATLGASPPLLLPARKSGDFHGRRGLPVFFSNPLPALSVHRHNTGHECAHGAHAWAQDEFICTSSQVQAHVHEHEYPHTHTASEQMTQRFLWKDVRSI